MSLYKYISQNNKKTLKWKKKDVFFAFWGRFAPFGCYLVKEDV